MFAVDSVEEILIVINYKVTEKKEAEKTGHFSIQSFWCGYWEQGERIQSGNQEKKLMLNFLVSHKMAFAKEKLVERTQKMSALLLVQMKETALIQMTVTYDLLTEAEEALYSFKETGLNKLY